MAYLTLPVTDDANGAYKFIGLNSTPNNNGGLITSDTSLITNNVSLITGEDSCTDTCSFYSGPSESTIFSFGESNTYTESGSYSGSESCGALASDGGSESCGSVATSSSSGFSGYSC